MANSLLLGECYRGLSELQEAMGRVDETGLRLTQVLSTVLKDSVYKYVGDVLMTRMSDVYTNAKSKAGLDIVNEMGSMLLKLQDLERQKKLDPDTYQHTLCHVSLLLIKLKRQYYSICSNRVADLVHSLLCLKGEEPAAGEVTKLVLKLGLADGLESPVKSNSSLPNSPWGSPKNRNKLSTSKSSSSHHRPGFRIMSLFERKSQSEERSSFYVDVDEESKSNSGKHRNPNQMTADVVADTNTNTTAASEDKSLPKKTPLSIAPTAAEKKVLSSDTANSSISQDQPIKPPPPSVVSLSWALPPSSSILATAERSSNSSFNHPTQSSFSTPTSTSTLSAETENAPEPLSKLASEEDLESIINLLSGMGPSDSVSPMQAIPEVPLPHMPGGPIQLVVPQIYRLPSPASDTQVEELRSPSRQHQAHRRSEGCLDLSSMRPSSLHHHHQHFPPPPHLQQQQQQQLQQQQQQQHHHPRFINTQQPPPPLNPNAASNLNLPWVQIQSASSHGSISTGSVSDCPSPISGYTAGDSSPGYAMSPSPSFPSSPARLPISSASGAVAPNSLSVGSAGSMSLSMPNMRGRSLSPFQQHHHHHLQQQQQWGGVGGSSSTGAVNSGMFVGSGTGAPVSPGMATAPGAIGGGSSPRLALTPEFGHRQQGTWPPTYGGEPTPSQMNMGWSGVQDSSDLSDDSSTEDQFFAVGTDLCHALDSKGDSSDEEGFPGHPGQAKNSSTWPLPNIPAGVSDVVPNRGLTPDLLEPPDLYHQAHHRPVQMQWSDPMSSRSEWPARSLAGAEMT